MTISTGAGLIAAYLRHRKGLYAVALSLTRSLSLAEDVLQEAFANAWARHENVRGDATAYLFATVRNVAIDQQRKKRPSSVDPDTLTSIFGSPLEDPAKEAEDAELHRRARAIVDGLPGDEREMLAMRVYAGLSFSQIGEALGMPTSTVADHYQRTLERIRIQLERRGGQPTQES